MAVLYRRRLRPFIIGVIGAYVVIYCLAQPFREFVDQLLLSRPLQRTFKIPDSSKSAALQLSAVLVTTTESNFTFNFQQLGLRPSDSSAVYVAGDMHAALHPPFNKGRESISYLTYLIDHYDELPELMVFLHGEYKAWHNNALFGGNTTLVLSHLRREYVVERGYANLLCDWRTTCPSLLPLHTLDDPSGSEEYAHVRPRLLRFKQAWKDLFRGVEQPATIAAATGGQFAVTNSAIRKRVPRDRFIHLSEWVLNNDFSSFQTGEIMEYLWHILFLGPDNAVNCPPPAECYCQMYRVCFDDSNGTSVSAQQALKDWEALDDRRTDQILQLSKLRDASNDPGVPDQDKHTKSIKALETEIAEIGKKLEDQVNQALERGYRMYPES
jgi:hypothetical protein